MRKFKEIKDLHGQGLELHVINRWEGIEITEVLFNVYWNGKLLGPAKYSELKGIQDRIWNIVKTSN